MGRALTTRVAVWASCFTLLVSVNSATSQAGTHLKIGFWNIRDLSMASRDSSELDQIATVAHAIDCLAICELNDGSVLDTLKSKLKAQGGKWERVQTSAKIHITWGSKTAYRIGEIKVFVN